MLEPKTVSSTAVENHTHKIFPQELNTNNTVFGGVIMKILDKICLVVAERHSESNCATVSVDALHFLAPAHLGEILLFKASLNRVWTTSMEVGIKVVAESIVTKETRHVVSAYFTFVALDENFKPKQVPPLIPETPIQMRRFEEAGLRRENRIREAKKREVRRSGR